MTELPSGTVSLLFSDIEGSTALLRRLGPAYAEALDGQRRVLRQAWADHGGTELATEGDSFYVVFPTAEGAVAAAAKGQRDLAGFEWPGDEQVRVRMGLHTGSPAVHEGAYVGMDVHRAARIAGAAHGGQVLLSDATSKLVNECLPEQVRVKDLGFHHLKDIATPEHLFELAIDGLPADFPPPKTLGTTSSLPRPATPLVGRDGELAELTALLSSPDVRLVTLTGPGGSGKTRLAIAVAERLADQFPDGVHFVPLAAITSVDVMWTSIAEVLNLPPEGRIPPAFFDHVAHRTALFVLDNLEQIEGGDDVVAGLSEHGPQVVVIVTSRRPMNVAGETQHAVPPLELPEEATLSKAERSGAVQMFVQHAKAVKGSFTLTASNAADVVALCRRLDGLPLALELASARVKLLSPSALVARLDKVLDLAATGSRVATRQKTLRDTIAWSYDLLDPTQQAFFRRLGVFAAGADLDAIAAVSGDTLDGADPLELLADLVDASLVTIADDSQGEPRIGMLETIRAYALDQLIAAGEWQQASRAYVDHYLSVVEHLPNPLLGGTFERLLEARGRLALEHDNLREVLRWALYSDDGGIPPPDHVMLGLGLCGKLGPLWEDGGYYIEGRRWLERVVGLVAGQDSAALANCLLALARLALDLGDPREAGSFADQAVAVSQRLGDSEHLIRSLTMWGAMQAESGEVGAATDNLQQAVALAEDTGDLHQLASCLATLAHAEGHAHNHERSLQLYSTALDIFVELGDDVSALGARHNQACTLREMGRLSEAARDFASLIPLVLRVYDPYGLIAMAEDYAAVLAELGRHDRAVRLLGAAEAMRASNAIPRHSSQEAQIAEPLAKARGALSEEAWEHEYQVGCTITVEDALTEAHAATANLNG